MDRFADQRFRYSFFVTLYACLLAGCSAGAGSSRRDPRVIDFLIESAPTNLDPRFGTDAQSEDIDGLLFDSLVARDRQMNVIPDLAESWETPDPLTYVFHLRHNVKFHDGRAFSSADVKFTFDSILSGAARSPKRGAFETIRSVDTPDTYTAVFHLSEPYASFLWNLASPAIGIVPQGSPPGMDGHPVGTGPFEFIHMEQDEKIELKRNDSYFGQHPDISGVRFRIVPDAVVRALELRKGSADIGGVNSLTPDMVNALSRMPGLVAEQQPGTQLAYIAFNFNYSILAHREVRQALAYATDRVSLIQYLLRGEARAAGSLLPPNHWGYDSNVTQYNYDPARAEELLDAAGFPRAKDGVRFRLELKTSTEESTRLLAEAIADEWKRVGVQLDLRPLEFATFYSDITRGSFQLYTFRWVGANNDPDTFQYVFGSHKMPPDGANRGHYRNPSLDLLLDQQHSEMNQESRKQLLSQVQEIVAEDEPYINLWYVDNISVHRDRVSKFAISPAGDYDFLSTLQLK
jgi:peptide/nickel transport system substrate-binding protein